MPDKRTLKADPYSLSPKERKKEEEERKEKHLHERVSISLKINGSQRVVRCID